MGSTIELSNRGVDCLLAKEMRSELWFYLTCIDMTWSVSPQELYIILIYTEACSRLYRPSLLVTNRMRAFVQRMLITWSCPIGYIFSIYTSQQYKHLLLWLRTVACVYRFWDHHTMHGQSNRSRWHQLCSKDRRLPRSSYSRLTHTTTIEKKMHCCW